jgi:choice-of-anchor C domain-containing protein
MIMSQNSHPAPRHGGGLLIATALLCGLAVSAYGAPFTNGNFEAPLIAGTGGHAGFVKVWGPSDNTSIPGWTATQVDWMDTRWPAAPLGGHAIDMNGNFQGTLWQSFDTVAGATYTVSFLMAGNPDGAPAIKQLTVTAPGYANTFTFDVTGHTPTDMGWIAQSFAFTATADTSTLTFVGDPTLIDYPGIGIRGYYGPALANVAVSMVPEPSTLALLGTGLLGILLLGHAAARRRGAYA